MITLSDVAPLVGNGASAWVALRASQVWSATRHGQIGRIAVVGGDRLAKVAAEWAAWKGVA